MRNMLFEILTSYEFETFATLKYLNRRDKIIYVRNCLIFNAYIVARVVHLILVNLTYVLNCLQVRRLIQTFK